MALQELQAQVEASREALEARRRDTRIALSDEQAEVAAHVALEQALAAETWKQAQLDNGVPEEHIDVARRVVTNLPLGPVHVNTVLPDGTEGVVTYHPESDEADALRLDPSKGPSLTLGDPLNPEAHLPWKDPS